MAKKVTYEKGESAAYEKQEEKLMKKFGTVTKKGKSK